MRFSELKKYFLKNFSACITLDNAGEVSLMKFSPNSQKPYKLGYIDAREVILKINRLYLGKQLPKKGVHSFIQHSSNDFDEIWVSNIARRFPWI